MSNNKLTENQVEFNIFIKVDSEVDKIDEIYEKIIECTESIGSAYIWNNESFFMNKPVRSDPTNAAKVQFYSSSGICDYGDNVDDEWFIVYLLGALTKLYPMKLSAQIYDADGEFLLIHAANFLPTWAQSAGDNCMKNRVHLFNGQLHMIPPASKPSQITYLPASGPIDNNLDAVKCVFDFPKQTLADSKIQECILKKITTFDTDLNKACFHRTTCIIPAKLAWLLNHNQSLISAAVNRFCEKDPNDLKLCRFLNHFKPQDLVSYRVQFTKHLYGKMKYLDYKPDKRHEWPTVDALMSQNLGPTIKFETLSDSAPSTKNVSSLVRERALLGFKLTCAFEIVINNILNSKNSKSFDDYLDRLKKLGYFKNYMEHSQKYNELMNKAKESFSLHEKINESDNNQEKTSKAKPIVEPIQSLPKKDLPKKVNTDYVHLLESIYLGNHAPSEDHFTELKTEINEKQNTGKDDSDEWLCVEAPQLDDYLEMYSRGEASSTYDFSMISNAFKRFLKTPQVEKDLLEGVDYDSIDKECSGELIDFNIDSIEKNLNDLLKPPSAKVAEDDENDSFYEVDDDLLEDEETNADLADLKNYMGSMDNQLKDNKDLSRPKDADDELDLDLNLVSNALESYSSQLGCSGPVSNILKSLGL